MIHHIINLQRIWVFCHICQILDALIVGFFTAQAMLTEWLVAYCEHTGVFTGKKVAQIGFCFGSWLISFGEKSPMEK